MAEIVLSSFLNVLFEKLATAALKKIDQYTGIDAEIDKLQRSLTHIQDLLADASQKEFTNRSVKRWLNDLQHLAYDMDDVLDDLATEVMHREFAHRSKPITTTVRKLIPIPVCCTTFALTHDKLENITARLQQLVDQNSSLGLIARTQTRSRDINRALQTSMLNASSIVGRENDKTALITKLLQDEGGVQSFTVVPILGMGGVGKTTLARLLYDEPQVNDHFELKAWVCVSDEFDSFAISKVIFQAVTGEIKEFADLNLLQEDLKERLRGQKFLLTLDDVWSENCQDWETLVGPFHVCAPGSKIILTTRKDALLKKLGYGNLTQLQTLSSNDALSLFALYALGEYNFDSHLPLKPYALNIVEKCDGLPLALKALGRLLSTRIAEEGYWKKICESEIWMTPARDEIAPALRLSYQDLPAHLKQLFAYCSLFPKDYVFDKEPLVQLWMAEGFVYQSTSSESTGERLGLEYFDELLSRSFFQHAPDNESLFVMHDLMNDLATSVADEFVLRLENDKQKKALEMYRHVSCVCEKYAAYQKFEELKRAKSLRTFLAISARANSLLHLPNKVLVDLLPELPLLRVLSFSGSKISEVPDSVGTLRHLRYLNLSNTRIKQLPENVSNLYNLETLIVFGCDKLIKLPNNFLKLKNLRHLDIRGTPRLNQLPLGIGELKSLQTLSKFIIRGKSGHEITKVKDLENLCGKVSIAGLEKVQNATDALEANISAKRLSELEFVWTDASGKEILEKEVLNQLKPNNGYLKILKIVSYGGLEFPKWVADPSFQLLKQVSLSGCKKCSSLPPLAQLQSLKELFFEGMDEVKLVGLELLGTESEFRSLEILRFENMGGWQNWSTDSGVAFPLLKELSIVNCGNLVELTLGELPSLNTLNLDGCANLVNVSVEALPTLNVLRMDACDSGVLRRLVETALAVTNLEIKRVSGLNDVVWRDVIRYLGAVEKLIIDRCNEIRYLWESEEVASKLFLKLNHLRVHACDGLVSLGEIEEEDDCRSNLLTSLRRLFVCHCKKMECCWCPYNVEDLIVTLCGRITVPCLPTGEQKLKSLTVWGCENLLETEWGGQKSRMLEEVRINDWRNLKSVTGLNQLVHLTTLHINNCENLESLPENELPNLTSLKNLHIVSCPSMDACGVWPPNLHSLEIGRLKKPISEWGPQNIPTTVVALKLYCGEDEDGVASCSQLSHLLHSSLTSLTIYGFHKLESVSRGLQHLTSLQRLHIDWCHNLKEVSHLQHLTSLQQLSFSDCRSLNNLSHSQPHPSLRHLSIVRCNVTHLPEMMLPSLLSLTIDNEELLKRYMKGSRWPLISHIPCISQL